MYLYVLVLYLCFILYVFCMNCMYLAECVWIDAPSNFWCKKYKQIHTIQTHIYIIHTPNLHHTYTKYIQNKSVTMCIYVYLCACILHVFSICMYVYVLWCMYMPVLCLYDCILCIQRHDLTCMLYVHVFACICMYHLPVTVHPWLYVCSWATLSITCCRTNEKGPFVLKFCYIFQRATAG